MYALSETAVLIQITRLILVKKEIDGDISQTQKQLIVTLGLIEVSFLLMCVAKAYIATKRKL